MMLRPWEFYRYTMEEFILASRGFESQELETMRRFRLVGWAAMAPHVKEKTTPESWMPLPGDQKGSALTLEDALARKKQLYDLGILRAN